MKDNNAVNDDDCQKPAVIVCRQWQQWQSLLMEAAIDGGQGDGGLRQLRSSSTEAAVGWRDDDTIASAVMVSTADGGSGNGGHHHQLCSGS